MESLTGKIEKISEDIISQIKMLQKENFPKRIILEYGDIDELIKERENFNELVRILDKTYKTPIFLKQKGKYTSQDKDYSIDFTRYYDGSFHFNPKQENSKREEPVKSEAV